ncbi:MAG: DUF1553 domain-containing protein, partial [Planctomycetaceae bacterium]
THKFDPLTHTDYFALMALLDNADEPEWTIPSADRDRRLAEIRRRIDAAWAAILARQAEFQEAFDAWEAEAARRAVVWRVARPEAVTSSLPHLTVRDDGSVLAGGDVTKSTVYEVTLAPCDVETRSMRLEVLPDESLPEHGPGMIWYEGAKGDFFLSEFEVMAGGRRIAVAKASESFAGKPSSSRDESSAAKTVDGDMSSGWGIDGRQGRAEAAVYSLAEPVPAGTPISVTLRSERHYACALGRFRLSVSDRGDAEALGHTAAVEAILAVPRDGRSTGDQDLLWKRFFERAPEAADSMKEIRRLENDLRDGTTTLVLQERPAEHRRVTHRRHRGEFTQPLEPVAAAAPAFLPSLPAGVPSDRLALARWLVSADNPLTARVTVNRHWQAFFGRGLVATLEDFGHQSEPPSHPDLLDWLAVAFMHDLDWSVKKLHRLIVTSATYRQSSAATADLATSDPANVLLARGPRVRLEAEVIRDSMLAAAGILSTKMGGPGVRPPQPEGVTEVAYGNPKWSASSGEDRHRRSIYTFQKRTAPFAMTITFDGPTGESCVVRRDVSNSPLQALTLLNDPMFVEVARALGEAVMRAGSSDDTRLAALGRRLLSRPFDAEERAALAAFLATCRQRLEAGELDAPQLVGDEESAAVERAAWMLVARAAMNLDEAIVKR